MIDYLRWAFETIGDETLWQVLSDAATAIAVFLGGIWAYRVYVQKRQRFPRAEVRHSVEEIPLSAGRHLLRVTVHIENKGDVLLRVADGDVRVAPVLPLTDASDESLRARGSTIPYSSARFPWLVKWKCEWKDGESSIEVEPGESHHAHFDFLLDSPVSVVHVYSYIGNKLKPRRLRRPKPMGWKYVSYHRLADHKATSISPHVEATGDDGLPKALPAEGGITNVGTGELSVGLAPAAQPRSI